MVTMDVSPVFVDTNILVYASLAGSTFYQQARNRLEEFENQGVRLWISRQIVREYLATMTRPGTTAVVTPVAILVQDVRNLIARFEIAEDGLSSTERLLALIQQVNVGGRQIHDANIVATMQAYNIPRLLTHNVADFVRFSHLITVLTL